MIVLISRNSTTRTSNKWARLASYHSSVNAPQKHHNERRTRASWWRGLKSSFRSIQRAFSYDKTTDSQCWRTDLQLQQKLVISKWDEKKFRTFYLQSIFGISPVWETTPVKIKLFEISKKLPIKQRIIEDTCENWVCINFSGEYNLPLNGMLVQRIPWSWKNSSIWNTNKQVLRLWNGQKRSLDML